MEERRAHHLLYEQPHGCSIIRRENDKEVRVDIPGSTVLLPIDVRDQRTLVIFDGFIVAGGLPRNHLVVVLEKILDLSVPTGQFRISCELGADTPQVFDFENMEKGTRSISADHWRYFVLLPSCRAVVFRYRPKSLSPQGVVIEVSKGRVEFKTTSY